MRPDVEELGRKSKLGNLGSTGKIGVTEMRVLATAGIKNA